MVSVSPGTDNLSAGVFGLRRGRWENECGLPCGAAPCGVPAPRSGGRCSWRRPPLHCVAVLTSVALPEAEKMTLPLLCVVLVWFGFTHSFLSKRTSVFLISAYLTSSLKLSRIPNPQNLR